MAEKVAVVTGASRGIGKAISLHLAMEGFTVVVNYRSNRSDAEAVVNQISASGSGSAICYQADVADYEATRAMFDRIVSLFGRVDVLVNNAGFSHDSLLLLTPITSWWDVLRGNLAPPLNCCKHVLPIMIERHQGTIINIASTSGIKGVEGQTAYSSAKAGIIGFTKALAREVASFGINVNCVAPGPIDTDMYASVSEKKRNARLSVLPLGRLGRPEEVAEVVTFLALGKSPFLFGQVIAVDGGATI
jgi:3-oxoacyl-[acyl-carrier protein] reductase